MTPEKKQEGGGGLAALVFLAVVFCWPVRGTDKGEIPSASTTRYHVLRFWGAKVKPTRAVVDAEIKRAAHLYGLDAKILRALVKVESAFNHRAVSPVGARGLGQVMESNLRRCGLKDPDELFDPVKNLRCSAQILAEDLKTYGGNIKHALVSYNCGRLNCPPGHQYAAKVLSIANS